MNRLKTWSDVIWRYAWRMLFWTLIVTIMQSFQNKLQLWSQCIHMLIAWSVYLCWIDLNFPDKHTIKYRGIKTRLQNKFPLDWVPLDQHINCYRLLPHAISPYGRNCRWPDMHTETSIRRHQGKARKCQHTFQPLVLNTSCQLHCITKLNIYRIYSGQTRWNLNLIGLYSVSYKAIIFIFDWFNCAYGIQIYIDVFQMSRVCYG